jgi:hypothetical protein
MSTGGQLKGARGISVFLMATFNSWRHLEFGRPEI